MKCIILLSALILATFLVNGQEQETYEPEVAQLLPVPNPETDLATSYGTMVRTGEDRYTVTLKGVSMRKGVDLLVDATVKARLPIQEFDAFTIVYDGENYTMSYEEGEPIITSSDIGDIKKELKKQMKMILDNL